MLQRIIEKRFIVSSALALLVAILVPMFITYDTGVQCVSEPCDESTAITSFIGWLSKGQPLIFEVNYAIPTVGFFVYGAIIYWLYPKVFKTNNH